MDTNKRIREGVEMMTVTKMPLEVSDLARKEIEDRMWRKLADDLWEHVHGPVFRVVRGEVLELSASASREEA